MSTISGTSYREWFNNQYRNDDSTYNSSKTGGVDYGDAKFTDKKDNGVSVDDFLNLMVAQLKNQDFMNPVDDTQYVSQLAQFATMQQMQELASYSKSNYVMSLVGKNVTAANFTISGKLDKTTGVVTKISLVDNEYHIYIGEKSFTLEQIMEIGGAAPPTKPNEIDYAKAAYLQSLVGKNVTATQVDEDGTKDTVTGFVDHISMADGKYLFFIGDKSFTLEELVQINSDKAKDEEDSGAAASGDSVGDVTNGADVDQTGPEVDASIQGQTNPGSGANEEIGGGAAADDTLNNADGTNDTPNGSDLSGLIEV